MTIDPSLAELRTELPASLFLADTAAEAAWAREDDSVLTEQERNYAREFDAEAATTWSAGRVVLRHVLGAHLDRDPAGIDIRLDSAGKPRHDDCEFSVSRSADSSSSPSPTIRSASTSKPYRSRPLPPRPCSSCIRVRELNSTSCPDPRWLRSSHACGLARKPSCER